MICQPWKDRIPFVIQPVKMEDLSSHPQSQKDESQTVEDSSRLVEVVCLDESNVEGGDDENISVSYTIDKIIDSRKEEVAKLS